MYCLMPFSFNGKEYLDVIDTNTNPDQKHKLICICVETVGWKYSTVLEPVNTLVNCYNSAYLAEDTDRMEEYHNKIINYQYRS